MKKNRPKKPSLLLTTPLEYWLGLIHFKRKRWKDADACFSAAILKNQAHAPSTFKRGQIAFKRKKWEDAYRLIERAVFLDPSRRQWMVQFRQVLDRLDGIVVQGNEFTEAEVRAQLEIYDKSSFLYSELAKILRAGRKWWQELDALKSAIRFDEGNPDLHYRLGRALEAMQRYVEASDYYERAVELAPGNSFWYFRLGYCLEREGHDGPPDPEKAKIYLSKAIAAADSGEQPRVGIGAFYQNEGRWDLAATAYRLTLEKSPHDADLVFRIGMCHDRCYEWSKAEEAYLRAIDLDGGVPYWHFRLGFVRERQRNLAGAAESYATAANSSDKRSFSWSYKLGYVLEKQGRYEEACDAYVKAQKDDAIPDKSSPDEDSPRSVIDSIESRLAADATDSELWWLLGNACERREAWLKAVEAYQQAVSRSDIHDKRCYQRMGRCWMNLGEFGKACSCFRDTRILQRPQGVSEADFRNDEILRKNVTYTEYYETLAIRDKTVLYESFHGKVMSCNPYALFLHLLGDGGYEDWTHIWVIDDKSNIPERFKRMTNVVFVSRDSDTYLRYLASVRVLINNVTFPACFIRKEGQIYLNTWHGTPWKMMGKDVRGEFMIFGNVTRNFLQASHIISPNRYTTDILIGKYNVEGLYRGVISETGYPRIDLTLNASEAEKLSLRKRLGINDTKKVVLYAPTWRGMHGKAEIESEEVMHEIARLKSIDCHVLFRGHTLSGGQTADINVPEDIATNELLAIVDVLVTDYSSIFFDFIATGRPVVFYLKDYEQYSRDRGLYFEMNELPGEVADRLDDLIPLVGKEVAGGEFRHPGYAEASRKFCPFEDGLACKRVVDLIFSGKGEAVSQVRGNSILVYGGGFLNSGITSSLLNLLNAIDYSKVGVTLAVEPLLISGDEDRIRNIGSVPEDVRILPRIGTTNTTLEERMIRIRVRRTYGLLGNEEIAACYKSLYAREFKRLFGSCYFDAVIDMEGYNVFWASILSCAPPAATGQRTVYQHSDKIAEWKAKFPQLEAMFNIYRFYDRIISVSKMTMENNITGLSELFKLPPSKFDYVENMLNPSRILARAAEKIELGEARRIFGSGGPVFVTVGRLSIEKDHSKLIRAFAVLSKSRPAARLVIVGDGPLMDELRSLVENLKLTKSVFLTGYCENPFPYLAKSDCFVLSSNHEGQPMVILEAIVLNKPIISTDIIGARGVIEGRSGQLVENSIEGLTGGMRDFIDGKIEAKPVDMDAYQKNALDAFYRKACNFEDMS